MKLAGIIIFIFMLLVGNSVNTLAQDLSGPEIFGFRLGMTMEQIKDVASKNNYTVEKLVPFSEYSPRFNVLEQGKEIGTLVFGAETKQLKEMIFGPKSFNTSKIDENFILKFLQHYKISVNKNLVKETRDEPIIPVPDDGYTLVFNTKFGAFLRILQTTKSSDINFR